MTTYYVSPSGNNSNNGLGPDQSHGTNRPWLTLAKALGATGISSGDTVYIAPGTYREVASVAMTSATVETFVIGDPSNAQGFKDGSGVLLAAADVIHTAYLTNDTSAPSATATLSLSGRDFLTFRTIIFVGGSGAVINATTTNSINIKFQDCTFLNSGTGSTFGYNGVADAAANWTIDRCLSVCFNFATHIDLSFPTSTTADYDVVFLLQNSIFMGGILGVTCATSAANSFKPGGVDALNCTFFGTSTAAFRTNSANMATTIPCTVNNCLITCQAAGITANTAGQIANPEYCRITANTALTNVTAGTGTVTGLTYAPMLEVGQSLFMGRTMRPFMSPTSGSPILGFGSTGAPSVDILNRPRPSGGASLNNAVGAQERHQIASKETSVTQTGSSSWKIIGPGDHDIAIPVDASATVLTIYARYDTTHDATNKPQAILLANGEIGVVTETKTMAAAADTWEQLSFSSFTPTAKGYVTVRLVSRSAAGGGIAYFDTAAGGASSTATFDYFRQGEPLSTIVAGSAGGGLIGGGTLTGGTQ
jgi:hypothetical protein